MGKGLFLLLVAVTVSCGSACGGELPYLQAPDEGFVPLFNGRDLSGWIGATNSYGVEKYGVLSCFPERAKPGDPVNLFTEKEYGDFILRFEFCLSTNANNGLGIRSQVSENVSYEGMCELQMLDDGGDKYTALKPYQYHGSVYGIVPAKRDATGKVNEKKSAGNGSYLKPVGKWNFEEVRVIGSRIQVMLNGVMIVDADVAGIKGDGTDTPDGKKHPGLHNRKGRIGWLGHGYRVQWRNIRIREVPADYEVGGCPRLNQAPAGFTELFDGKTLAGWKGVTFTENFDSPYVREAAPPEKLAEIQKLADAQMREHWHARDGALFFDGFKGGYSLATAKEYSDFELWVDWRLLSVEGDSGIYLHGFPQVQIWDAHNLWHIGSGGLYDNRKKGPRHALVLADNLVGDWNRFYIRMTGDRVTVYLNGKLVVDNVAMENDWVADMPINLVGQTELQCHGDPLEFRNIFVRGLPYAIYRGR